MVYVPPHKRKREEHRRKALVIPTINNKYIVSRNRETGNTTFMGGGCKSRENNKSCALRELREESRNTVKGNLKNFFVFSVGPEYRSKKELANNNKKGIYVITNYKVYSLTPMNNFNKIYKNFHNKKSSSSEMKNIMLQSLNNLNRNRKLWVLMRNKVLPKLKSF